MNHAANPQNLKWAERKARHFGRTSRHLIDEFIGAANLGLTKASNHPDCPEDPDQFRAFAHKWVRGAILDERRAFIPERVRRGKGSNVISFGEIDVPDRGEDPKAQMEWLEWREHLAASLTPRQAQIFRMMYGERDSLTKIQVARSLGVVWETIYQHHMRIKSRLEDLYAPCRDA